MSRAIALGSLVTIAALASAAAADPIGGTSRPAAARPPSFFRALVGSLGQAGFHRDTRETRWMGGSVCDGVEARDTRACQLIERTWRVSVVASRRSGDEPVVQELWLFQTASDADAAAALASLRTDIPYGPFAKRPYELYAHGRHIVAIEGRARWHTARVRLAGHVEAFLARARSVLESDP